ncbi:MAG: hypothetical protein Q7R57_06215 [Dehalococcoidales bacterium]|nr:hypothetical protein [Dehalococcoidales bacterium]
MFVVNSQFFRVGVVGFIGQAQVLDNSGKLGCRRADSGKLGECVLFFNSRSTDRVIIGVSPE